MTLLRTAISSSSTCLGSSSSINSSNNSANSTLGTSLTSTGTSVTLAPILKNADDEFNVSFRFNRTSKTISRKRKTIKTR